MKKLINILFYLFSIIIGLLSLVMMLIELRLIISFDFTLYDSAFNGFIRYLFRLALSILSFTIGLFEIINIKKKNERILLPLQVKAF